MEGLRRAFCPSLQRLFGKTGSTVSTVPRHSSRSTAELLILACLKEKRAHPMSPERSSSPVFCMISLFHHEISPNQLNSTLSKEMEAKSLWPRALGTALTLFHSSLKDYLEFNLAGKLHSMY